MPRTQEQIGTLAFAMFAALSKADMTINEMKALGESIWSNSPWDKTVNPPTEKTKEIFTKQSMETLGKLPKSSLVKLFRAAKELDAAFPLPEPAVVPVETPTPAETVAIKTETPPAPAPNGTPVSMNDVTHPPDESPRG